MISGMSPRSDEIHGSVYGMGGPLRCARLDRSARRISAAPRMDLHVHITELSWLPQAFTRSRWT